MLKNGINGASLVMEKGWKTESLRLRSYECLGNEEVVGWRIGSSSQNERRNKKV